MRIASAFLCAAALLWPADSHAQRAQTISRAELDAGGWTRLSELVFALRGVARTSVDGITVQGDVSGIASWTLAPDASWDILVDGQPIPLEVGGATMLDLLPVSLAQLDSVTLLRAPSLAGSRLAMHGVLHLHTQRGRRGVRASASHYSGNEAGDPGPFAFTPEATPNVDNSGPFHQARLAYGTGAWDVDAAVRRWTDNLTDARMRARYEQAAAPSAPDLWVQQLAPTLRIGTTRHGWRHDAYAGAARLRGTFFLPAPGEDQSLSTRLIHGGIAGSRTGASHTRAAYRLSASGLESRAYDAPLPSTFAHRRREVNGALHASRSIGAVQWTVGASAAQRTLPSAPALESGVPERETELDALLSVEAGGAWRPIAAATAGRGLGGARGAGMLSVRRALDVRNAVELRAAASLRALGDDGAWVDLTLFGLPHLRAERRTSASASAEWTRLLGKAATLAVGGTARRETGVRVVTPDSAPTLSSVARRTSGAASVASGELLAGVELPFGGIAHGGATYRYSTPFGGSSIAQDAQRVLPRHLFDASLTAVPAFDIRVRTAVHLASRTTWQPAGAGERTFVPAVARFDLSLEKWVLARHVRLQVLARNLLNDVERYHPLGADFRLRVFAGATASF